MSGTKSSATLFESNTATPFPHFLYVQVQRFESIRAECGDIVNFVVVKGIRVSVLFSDFVLVGDALD